MSEYVATSGAATAGSVGSSDKPHPRGVVCVVDLGEHSRKRVRKLRRGEGRLMEKVEDVIADLAEQGVLSANSQTVVVVVRQEPTIGGLFGADDDDDD